MAKKSPLRTMAIAEKQQLQRMGIIQRQAPVARLLLLPRGHPRQLAVGQIQRRRHEERAHVRGRHRTELLHKHLARRRHRQHIRIIPEKRHGHILHLPVGNQQVIHRALRALAQVENLHRVQGGDHQVRLRVRHPKGLDDEVAAVNGADIHRDHLVGARVRVHQHGHAVLGARHHQEALAEWVHHDGGDVEREVDVAVAGEGELGAGAGAGCVRATTTTAAGCGTGVEGQLMAVADLFQEVGELIDRDFVLVHGHGQEFGRAVREDGHDAAPHSAVDLRWPIG